MSFAFVPDLDRSLPSDTVTVRHGSDDYVLDVLAMTSNYRCIYGQGCRGTTPLEGERPGRYRPGDPSVTGCCRTSPVYRRATAEVAAGEEATDDSPLRVAPFVAALRPNEAQHYDRIAAGDWYTEVADGDGRWTARHTTDRGNCIFLNTEMASGRTGCALFHVAARLGLDAKDTRPFACHVAPAAAFLLDDVPPGGGTRVLVTLQPHWFGWFSADGYFCTSDPAAFSAGEPVFRRMNSEFSTLLGEDVYAALLPTLEEIWAERGARLRRGWGQPAPLPTPTWAV